MKDKTTTPTETVEYLDKYIIGQSNAKKVLVQESERLALKSTITVSLSQKGSTHGMVEYHI